MRPRRPTPETRRTAVIQTLTGEGIGPIARAAFPFFLIMAAFTLLIAMFPEIVTLPAGALEHVSGAFAATRTDD